MTKYHWTSYSTRVPDGNGAFGVIVEKQIEGFKAGAPTSSCCAAQEDASVVSRH